MHSSSILIQKCTCDDCLLVLNFWLRCTFQSLMQNKRFPLSLSLVWRVHIFSFAKVLIKSMCSEFFMAVPSTRRKCTTIHMCCMQDRKYWWMSFLELGRATAQENDRKKRYMLYMFNCLTNAFSFMG